MSDSDVSTDTDDDGNTPSNRREELKRRLHAFREKKTEKQKMAVPRCCQLVVPEDYNDYMELEAALIKHGFAIVKGSLDLGSELPSMQWCPHRSVAWELVFRGKLVCNHYYMRSGLIRKAELCELLSVSAPDCIPQSYTAHLDKPAAVSAFTTLIQSLCEEGIWILKAGDSSNATDLYVFDQAGLPRVLSVLEATQRQSWLVQRYIERPLLVDGRKFHLRAMVLAVGRLQVYLHEKAIALLSARDYTLDNLEDLPTHATNHSVQERLAADDFAARLGGGGGGAAVLLSDLARRADTLPPVHRLPYPLHPDAAAAGGGRSGGGGGGGGGDVGRWTWDVWQELAKITGMIFAASVSRGGAGGASSDGGWADADPPPPAAHTGPSAAADGAAAAAASKAGRSRFLPLASGYELYGLDAMIDAAGRVWLLELNADPDLAVFDQPYRQIAQGIVSDTIDIVVSAFFPPPSGAAPTAAASATARDSSAGDGGGGSRGGGSGDAVRSGYRLVYSLPPA